MKKKLLPLAIAAAMAPGFASAADTSGFVDILYTISDEGTPDDANGNSPTEGKFGASGEVDVSASPADGVTVRLDVDLMLDGGTGDSASLEQAFFAWGATEGVTVLGGVFNNPIGAEAEDAPDMWGTNHGVVWNILDNQTALYGDNVAGLAAAGAVGPATVTVGVLNDLQHSNGETSLALVVNASPMAGLDLELGFATQDDDQDDDGTVDTAGNVVDFNVQYSPAQVAGLSIGLDYLAPSEIIDSAYEVTIDYSMNNFGVGVRAEGVSYGVGDEETNSRTTFHASYQVASNLVAILEIADGTLDETVVTGVDGIAVDGLTTLELIGTF